MKKRIFRGASFILLTLSLPAIGWSLKDSDEIKSTTVPSHNTEIRAEETNAVKLSSKVLFDQYLQDLYTSTNLKQASLDFEVFKKALTGYYNFKNSNLISTEKQVISIVDFTKASTEKRLWIIDIAAKKLLFNTLVAHGQGSGNNYATSFSNTANSHQSSLGFYVTSNTYFGKHGLSLKLNGMDTNYNTNALDRAVVVHGAEYVSEEFIKQHGRLGRSHGCPALPVALTPAIIEAIKGKTTLFINGPSEKYASTYLDEELALTNFGQGSQLQATL
ncbi:murein L,D-transpeptidase catalytic domain family protein [Desertivirga xinjiangensis]|uniref:murein L,D-transpeptidase catalytic domain family protein n=1 Tax=Desertivirga xinjiangensis TaxID=539206 RepID=UPI00210DD2D4|nr:murein L,D-transpeptidase catalytic domain family protein [Pedobacter xinjiangensis]